MKEKDEYAKARVKDIKKAHEDGCDDVKRVLENMYPDILEGDISKEFIKDVQDIGDNVSTISSGNTHRQKYILWRLLGHMSIYGVMYNELDEEFRPKYERG